MFYGTHTLYQIALLSNEFKCQPGNLSKRTSLCVGREHFLMLRICNVTAELYEFKPVLHFSTQVNDSTLVHAYISFVNLLRMFYLKYMKYIIYAFHFSPMTYKVGLDSSCVRTWTWTSMSGTSSLKIVDRRGS